MRRRAAPQLISISPDAGGAARVVADVLSGGAAAGLIDAAALVLDPTVAAARGMLRVLDPRPGLTADGSAWPFQALHSPDCALHAAVGAHAAKGPPLDRTAAKGAIGTHVSFAPFLAVVTALCLVYCAAVHLVLGIFRRVLRCVAVPRLCPRPRGAGIFAAQPRESE